MLLEEIKPYIRYARYVEYGTEQHPVVYVPRDCRLFYTERGESRIRVDGCDYEMVPGSILFIRAGVPYRFHGGAVGYVAFNFDLSFAHRNLTVPIPPVSGRRLTREELVETLMLEDAPELERCLYLREGLGQRERLNRILAEFMARQICHELAESAEMTRVLLSLLRTVRRGQRRMDMEAVLAYVQAHFSEPLTNALVAEKFHFHPNYLSAACKQYCGKTLHQYIMELRVLEAIALMEKQQLTLEQIARRVGFYDSSYFSRYFKKFTGVLPSQYQR